MRPLTLKGWHVIGWQIIFLLFGTTWLAAPYLNDILSRRLTLISTYELPTQPYSWLFRLGDITAAMLLMYAGYYLLKRVRQPRRVFIGLMAIGFTMLLDPLFSVTCKLSGNHCIDFFSTSFALHAAETLGTAILVLGLSIYDAVRRKNLPSTIFVGFQVLYGALFISSLAKTYRFATLSQIVYQVLVLVWLAWLVAELIRRAEIDMPPYSTVIGVQIRRALAIWAYANGILAIVLSLVHIHLLGFVSDIYFAGNTAWLAQHGAVVGMVMIYLSRHLARGEHRARQLFLVLLFVEAIKYAAISPDLDLLAFYGISFVFLFALRPFFQRGSVSPDWHTRLQEAGLILSGLVGVAAIMTFLVSRNQRLYNITHETFSHFAGFAWYFHRIPHHALRSSLLAHTISALLLATLAFLLWSLFRPAHSVRPRRGRAERAEVRALLDENAVTSEDFFKLWPHDKYYFWSPNRKAFIAYTIVDSLVFALADPVGATKPTRTRLISDFTQHWHSRGFITCFLMATENSLPMYEQAGLNPFQIGSSAVIDIVGFMNEAYNDKWWRWQRNRGSKAGYEYHRAAPPHSDELIRQCRQVSRAWLERPGHRERGFALGTFTEAYLQQCVLHYLTDDSNAVIAFTNQVPSFPHLTQATVDMMRFLPEKNNAMPFLLANTIASLAEEGRFTHFDLGFVPLAKMDNRFMGIVKALAAGHVSAAGLEQFKGKFKPEWQKNYLVYDGDLGDLATIALRVDDAMKPD